MIKGNCLCGSVRYEIKEMKGPLVHCHCSFCRKAHSAAFSSNLSALKKDFVLIAGEGFLSSYEATNELSKDKKRYFCANCGSTLWHTKGSAPESMTFKMGCIEEFPDFDKQNFASYHIYRHSDKPWLKYEGLEEYGDTKQ